MKMLISSHNKKVLGQASGTRRPELVRCDCDPCELDGQCLLGPLVYKADIEVNGKVNTYIGQAKNTFKARVSQHNSNVRTGRKATRYSTFVLEKEGRKVYSLTLHGAKLVLYLGGRKVIGFVL